MSEPNQIDFDDCVYEFAHGRLTVSESDLDPERDLDTIEVAVAFGSTTHVLRFERDWRSMFDTSAAGRRFRLAGISNVDPAFGDEDWMDHIHTLVIEG